MDSTLMGQLMTQKQDGVSQNDVSNFEENKNQTQEVANKDILIMDH